MTLKPELLSCPFCGGYPLRNINNSIECSKCECHMGNSFKWNQRRPVSKEWPEKRPIMKAKDTLTSWQDSGWNACHDQFMKIINGDSNAQK